MQSVGPRNTAVAVTLDVHAEDDPDDLHVAMDVLAAHELRSTFFVPAILFRSVAHRQALRALSQYQHEVGSHAYHHNWVEIDALCSATTAAPLRFLETARAAYEDFYGREPQAFRSPVWCRPSSVAFDELARLGYEVDSSATPQRLDALGSRPFQSGWLFSRRAPHFVRPGLLEIPTSTALLPAASPVFSLLRRRLSRLFVSLLWIEAYLFPRVLVLQFDPKDLNRHARHQPLLPLTPRDFTFRRQGGLMFRSRLRSRNPAAVATTAAELLKLISAARVLTLSQIREAWLCEKVGQFDEDRPRPPS